MKALLRRVVPQHLRNRIARNRANFDRVWLSRRLPSAAPGAGSRAAEAACVFGLHRASLGMGRMAVLCAAELERAGVSVSRIDPSDVLGLPCDEPPFETAPLPPNAPVILPINPDVLAQALNRYGADVLRGRRVIGYWVYELEAAPASWRALNHVVHEVWAPSRFAADALAHTLQRPVRVAPLPVALKAQRSATPLEIEQERARFGVGPDGFLAVYNFSAASSLARKNPVGAITAFRHAFQGRSDARFVVRCVHADRHEGAMHEVREAARAAGGLVEVLERTGAEERGFAELAALYGACDVYLSLHRSEGFGLTMAEAMLAERAVVATGWSSNMDFMDESCAVIVPAKLVAVDDPQGAYTLPGTRWAEPDHDAAVAALRALAAEPERRAALARVGKARVASVLGGGAAARFLRDPDPTRGAAPLTQAPSL